MYFDRAKDYSYYAKAQSEIAYKFAFWLNEVMHTAPLLPIKDIIECGCGSGFLSTQLCINYPYSNLYLIDNALNMLKTCEENLTNKFVRIQRNIKYILSDAQNLDNIFRLNIKQERSCIVSSMCMQWFYDITKTLKYYLKNVKYVAFTIPTENSFSNWQNIHKKLNIPCALHQLISLKEIYNYPHLRHLKLIDINLSYKSCLEFMQHFKHIGAYDKKRHYSTAQLKQLLTYTKNINNHSFNTHYQIAMIICYS